MGEVIVPTFGSLFAGIGGIDLGLERAGWECQWQVENDPYCTKVLEKHWPDVQRFGDLKEVTELPPVDLIAGGFPCQPVSHAGKRKGEADERWLWPEFARIIRLVRPPLVLVENVPGLLSRGMGAVLGDLAALGYDAEWESLPAAAFGAPHLRYRVFIVGYRNTNRVGEDSIRGVQKGEKTNASGDGEVADAQCPGRDRLHERQQSGHMEADIGRSGTDGPGGAAAKDHCGGVQGEGAERSEEDVAHPERTRSQERKAQRENVGEEREAVERDGSAIFGEKPRRCDWWTVEPTLGLLADEFSPELDLAGMEDRPVRVARGVPERVGQLKGLGNAVVPIVAEWLGKRMLETWDFS